MDRRVSEIKVLEIKSMQIISRNGQILLLLQDVRVPVRTLFAARSFEVSALV